MTEAKKKRLRERQIELLKMFEGDFYQEKQVGDEWYIKSWNAGTQRWQVASYPESSYRRYKSFFREKDFSPVSPKSETHIPFIRPTLESVGELVKNK